MNDLTQKLIVALVIVPILVGIFRGWKEMGVTVGAIGISLFFANMDKFTSFKGGGTYPNFSLAINSKLMGDFEGRAEPGPGGPADFWSRKLVEIKVPDRTALSLDNGVPGEERFCEFQSAYTGQPKVFANQFPARHKLGGNIASVTGRVRTIPCRDVVDTDPASINRGRALYPGEVIWRHAPELVP